jgi:hypothetical protein
MAYSRGAKNEKFFLCEGLIEGKLKYFLKNYRVNQSLSFIVLH